jgi:hypothetical protein
VNSGICDSKELFKRIIIEFELKKNKDWKQLQNEWNSVLIKQSFVDMFENSRKNNNCFNVLKSSNYLGNPFNRYFDKNQTISDKLESISKYFKSHYNSQ